MPWSPTQFFPHPLANVRTYNAKRSVANVASYGIVDMLIWEGLGDLINKFRKRELGLDPLDAMRSPGLIHRLQVPYSYLWYLNHLPQFSKIMSNGEYIKVSISPIKTRRLAREHRCVWIQLPLHREQISTTRRPGCIPQRRPRSDLHRIWLNRR